MTENCCLPLGCANSPLSTPVLIARLNWVSKAAPGVTFLLFARMYFLRADRLCCKVMSVGAGKNRMGPKEVNKGAFLHFKRTTNNSPAAIALLELQERDVSAYDALVFFTSRRDDLIRGRAKSTSEKRQQHRADALRWTHVDDSILDHICQIKSAQARDLDLTTAEAMRQVGGWGDSDEPTFVGSMCGGRRRGLFRRRAGCFLGRHGIRVVRGGSRADELSNEMPNVGFASGRWGRIWVGAGWVRLLKLAKVRGKPPIYMWIRLK